MTPRLSYSRFTLPLLEDKFGLQIEIRLGFFNEIEPRPISDDLSRDLARNVPLAVAMRTEKARSELIVMPVLLELWEQTGRAVSFFSGVEFNVDAENGLIGACDFVFSLSPHQTTVQSPVVMMVEAKKDNFERGLAQCIAEMYAAKLFNEKRGNQIDEIFGVVTSGVVWQFVRLRGSEIVASGEEYQIKQPEKILGILWQMLAARLTRKN